MTGGIATAKRSRLIPPVGGKCSCQHALAVAASRHFVARRTLSERATETVLQYGDNRLKFTGGSLPAQTCARFRNGHDWPSPLGRCSIEFCAPRCATRRPFAEVHCAKTFNQRRA